MEQKCNECGGEIIERKNGEIISLVCSKCGLVLKDIHAGCGGEIKTKPTGKMKDVYAKGRCTQVNDYKVQCEKCKKIFGHW